MTIKKPTKFMGEPIKGSLKKFLEEADKKPEFEQRPESSVEKEGMIYVPSINLYIRKDKTQLGKNWYDSHKELKSEGLRMTTIFEFKEFIKYLRDDPNSENMGLYNDIVEVRSPWRGTWLDAKFEEKTGKLYVNYNHSYDNDGNLVVGSSEPLESCLMEDKKPGIDLNDWLDNSTSQGLPITNAKDGDLYYWFPRDERVAGFFANSGRAFLNCNRNPLDSYSSLGVFGCAEGTGEKKI